MDNGGSPIIEYKLFRDDGASGGFIEETAYDGVSTTYTFDSVADITLTAGLIYRFKYVANNAIGDSLDSSITSAAIAALPD